MERRNFYSNFVDIHSISSVFEFGCASGPNLKNIQTFSALEVFCFGYDINPGAIKLAKEQFNSDRSYFCTDFDRVLTEQTLNNGR